MIKSIFTYSNQNYERIHSENYGKAICSSKAEMSRRNFTSYNRGKYRIGAELLRENWTFIETLQNNCSLM